MFLLTHTRTNPDLLDPNMELEDAEKLTNQVTDAVAAVSELQSEVVTLQTLIHSVSMKMLQPSSGQKRSKALHFCMSQLLDSLDTLLLRLFTSIVLPTQSLHAHTHNYPPGIRQSHPV